MKIFFYSLILVLWCVCDCKAQFQARTGSINGTVVLGDTLLFFAEIQKPFTWPAEVRARQPGKNFVLYKAGEATMVTINNTTYRVLRVKMKDGSHRYYFVEELSQGKATLFFSTGSKYRFYVKTDKQTGLDRNNYREVISEVAGACESSFCNHQKTVFTKTSLSYFFDRYNEEELNARFPMPFIAAGTQYNFSSFILPESNYQNFKFDSRTIELSFYSPVISAHFPFYANPYLGTDIQLASLIGNSTATFGEIKTDNYLQDILIDFSMLQLDVALRYSYSWKRWEPFIAAGLSSIYTIDYSNQTAIFQVQNNIYTYEFIENFQTFSDWFAGVTIRQGVKYFFLPRNFIAAGWGYGHYFGMDNSDYQITSLHLHFSINFWPW